MTEKTIRTLYTRKLAGEKAGALAQEAGLSVQALVAAFRKLEAVAPTYPEPVEEPKPEEPVAVIISGPAKEEPVPEFTDEQLEAAKVAKQSGKGWGEVKSLLPGVGSWNRAHSILCRRFPSLKGTAM